MKAATQPNQNASSKPANDRPSRRSFYETVVIANNGTVVPESQWSRVASSTDPKEQRKQLKAAGMQAVRVFKTEEYANARKAHKDGLKQTAKTERDTALADAFKEADLEVHPRISSALRTLLPLYRSAPNRRTVTAFRNIIRTIIGSSPEFKSGAAAEDADTAVAH